GATATPVERPTAISRSITGRTALYGAAPSAEWTKQSTPAAFPYTTLFRSLTKNQAVATSQEAVQNQNEPQLRDENAHNDKSVHGVLNPTYQAGLRRDAVQPDIEAERKKRDEIEAGKSYCSRRFGGAT